MSVGYCVSGVMASGSIIASVGRLVPSTKLHHHVDGIIGATITATVRAVNKIRGVSDLSNVVATAN